MTECWDTANNSYQVTKLRSWYTFGEIDDTKQDNTIFLDIFTAVYSILSLHKSNYSYFHYQDPELEKIFINRLVEKDHITGEGNYYKLNREKKIIALFVRQYGRKY